MAFVFKAVEVIGGGVTDLLTGAKGAVLDVVDWVVDEIVGPVVLAVGNIVQTVMDDPITTILKLAALAGGPATAWAIPLIDGASTLAKGGSIEDALKATAVSYAGSKVGDFTSTQFDPAITKTLNATGSTGTSAVVANVVKAGTKSATTALVYGQDPVKAFVTGGLQAGLGAALGAVDDKLKDFTGQFDEAGNEVASSWNTLQNGVKDTIFAGLSAELEGGSVSAAGLTSVFTTGLVEKYSSLGNTMTKFLANNTGVSEAQAAVITSALNNAATVALAGNPEMSGEAFFAKIDQYGAEALTKIIDKPVDAGIDKLTGAAAKTETAATALSEVQNKAVTASEGFNALFNEKAGLLKTYNDEVANLETLKATGNATQAQVDAIKTRISAAATTYNTFSANNDAQMDAYRADYDKYVPQIAGLQATYDQEFQYMLSDIDDLNASMKPAYDQATLAAALSVRPNFDADAYTEFNGITSENAAEHFLLNGQKGPGSKSEAEATLDTIRLAAVESALNAKGIPLSALKPEQLAAYLAYADKEIQNISDAQELNLDTFANVMVTDAALSPKLTAALKDAGFIPQSTDDYGVFLSGEYIKLKEKNADGSNVFIDTTGMSGNDVKALLAENNLSTSDIVNAGDNFYDRVNDMAFEQPSISGVTDAVASFADDTKSAKTLETVSLGEGVSATELVNGTAILVNTGGKLSWELASVQTAKLGETDVSSVAINANANIEVVDAAFTALYGPQAFNGVPSGFSYLSEDKLTAYTADGEISMKNLPPVSGLVASTVAGLDDTQGKLFDTATGSKIWDTYNRLKNVYLTETPEDQQEAFTNAASVITGASGEMLQAISGLAVLAGANPNNALGGTAKSLLALSGDLRSDAWIAGAADMQARSQDYDKEWREANPGQEPSTAEKGWLKAKSIYGNLIDHPVQFLAENVASEILQEVPIFLLSGGVGNVAKAALLRGGSAYTASIAARVTGVKVGSALAIDGAEAFGGTAAGAFDETYASAIAAVNEDGSRKFTDEEATALAVDTAQTAGTIALITLAATAGFGGQALAKSILGDNASEFAGNAFQTLTKKIKDGTTVTIKEGTTEFIEEALPQLFTATVNSQIDPNYDVAGAVFETGFMGAVTGVGVGATLYSGNAVADALMSLNSGVIDLVKNAGNATAATLALNNLGITDTSILNNVLNSTYDKMYVSTNEATKIFKDAGFVPSTKEIESFVSNRPESDVAAAVATYIAPRYIDKEEVKAAALKEGLILTDEQAEKYTRQGDLGFETNAITEIKAELDPYGTSRQDVIDGFEAQDGYIPIEQEIIQFSNPKPFDDFIGPRVDLNTTLKDYVDDRQLTKAEVETELTRLGYKDPSDAELIELAGQGDANFAANRITGIETYADDRMVDEGEVTDAYAELGLTRPATEDIQKLIGQYAETELAGKAEESLPNARYNSIISIIDGMADDSGVTSEMQDALDLVKKDMINALGEQGLVVAKIDATTAKLETAVGKVASGEEDASGLYAYIDTAVTDLKDAGLTSADITTAIGGVVGSEAVLDADGNVVEPATGMFDTLTGIDADIDGLSDLLGAPAEGDTDASGLFEYIDTAVGELGSSVSELAGTLGTEAVLDAEGNVVTPATGAIGQLDALIASGLTRDQAITKLATDLGTTVSSLTTALGNLDTLSGDVGDLSGDVSDLSGDVGALSDVLGTPDNPDTDAVDPTGLFATIQAYEDAGIGRDNATQKAVDDVATALGLTKKDLLSQIGETETSLTNTIGDVETNLTGKIGDLDTSLTGKIGDVETSLTEDIGDVATDVTALGVDLDTVAQFVGKPAREVTQTDIDFVTDLIAQENVSEELTLQYDVTGDGIVDIADQNLLTDTLQGTTDTTLADTSIFDPATGLFLKQETDTQTTLDAITDVQTDINTQIDTQTKTQNVNQLAEMLAGADDLYGQQVTTTPGEKAQIDYLYDIGGDNIFATEQQAGLFASPYGTRRVQPQPANNPMGPMARASGFAQGGQVEDENDRLLRLLGEL